MLKRLLLTSALVASFASSASAHPHGPVVTLGGSLDTQLGYRDQKNDFDSITVAGTDRTHEFAVVNDTKLHVKVDGKGKNGLKYGGMLTLNADTSNNKTNHAAGSTFSNSVGYYTMGYVETSMGRLEAGTYTGAAEALKLNAACVSRATGGIDGDWRYWVNPKINTAAADTIKGNFVLAPDLPTNADKGGEDKAAKVTYHSPKWNGFNFAVSYIPDTEQHGTTSLTHTVTRNSVANTVDSFVNGGYKDVFSGGLHYHAKMKGVDFALSALGETGTAKDRPAATGREDLSAYEFGAKVHFMGVTFAGSYGDWDKSGTTSGATGKQDAHYWNVGAGYEYGPWGMSVAYFASEKGNGQAERAELSNVSLGVDYKLAPGFMPYAEVSFFDLDENYAAGRKNSGAVLLAGTKLMF